MENKIDLDNLTDDQQERMCKLCETFIIEGSSNSQHFQCEGTLCDRAIEYLIEDIEDEDEDKNNHKLVYKIQLK